MSEAMQSLSVDSATSAIEGLLAKDNEISDVEDVEETVEDEESETEESPEGDAEGEESEEATDEPEEETEEPAEVETLADLAKQLEVPIEELSAKLKHTVKIDGEELQVTLDELTAGYQKDRDYRQKTETLSREREAFTTQRQQVFEEFHKEHTVLAQLMGEAEKSLVGEINSQEMAYLRQSDQTAWLVKRYDLEQKVEHLRQVKQAAANQYVQKQQELESERTQTLQKQLDEERKQLVQKIPQFDAIKPKLTSYLKDAFGFSAEQLSGVTDHRLLIMAQKAMLYDEGASKALSVVKNKVIPAPKKTLQPSKPMSKVAISRARVGSARNALKKSGKLTDAASLILASGIVPRDKS